MKNGSRQRESKRDNVRQSDIEQIDDVLKSSGHLFPTPLSRAARIEFIIYDAERKVRAEEIKTAQEKANALIAKIEADTEIAQLKAALAHATNPVTEPVDEPDVPAEYILSAPPLTIAFEPPVSEEEKLGNVEIEP